MKLQREQQRKGSRGPCRRAWPSAESAGSRVSKAALKLNAFEMMEEDFLRLSTGSDGPINSANTFSILHFALHFSLILFIYLFMNEMNVSLAHLSCMPRLPRDVERQGRPRSDFGPPARPPRNSPGQTNKIQARHVLATARAVIIGSGRERAISGHVNRLPVFRL